MERKYAKINSDLGGEPSSKHDYQTNKSIGSQLCSFFVV